MKKMKLFMYMLLCAGMVFGVTACATKEPENKDVASSAVDSDIVVQNPSTEATDDAESSENADTDNNITTSEPDIILPGVGTDNGLLFATPILNGEPVNAKMDEVRLFSAADRISTGAIFNLAGTGEQYIVTELDTYGISFVKEDDYDREYCLVPGHLLYFEEEPEPLQFLESDGDIQYRYISGTLYANKNLDEYILSVSNYDVSEGISEETKAIVKNILDNITYVNDVDSEFASERNFDAVAFDWGWYIDNISYLYWRPKELHLGYELEGDFLEFEFELKEDFEEETHDNDSASYSIPMEDGTYLYLSICELESNDVLDIHNWSEVEAFLNGEN